jgi:hypothetical protein
MQIGLQDVGFDDLGIWQRAFTQVCGEALIQFDRDDLTGALGKFLCQNAKPRTNLNDEIAGPDLCRFRDAAHDSAIVQKILAERLARLNPQVVER